MKQRDTIVLWLGLIVCMVIGSLDALLWHVFARSRRVRVSPGDLVIYLADPLLLGGELLIVSVTRDNRLLCEAVHFDAENENDPPPRVVLDPHDVELASVWARQTI